MATKLLHLDSSILGDNSVSRSLSADVVATLRKANPDLEITYRDLAAVPLAHLSGRHLAAFQGVDLKDPSLQEDVKLGSAMLEEFLAADFIVLGVGFYNFGISTQLKAWIDRLCVAGKTFRYTAAGPEGLAGGKRVILAIARGGFYGPGTPTERFEHAEGHLRSIFTFFGISQIEVVLAEGLAAGPESRQAGIAHAQARIAALGG